jgi:hypothetical protein
MGYHRMAYSYTVLPPLLAQYHMCNNRASIYCFFWRPIVWRISIRRSNYLRQVTANAFIVCTFICRIITIVNHDNMIIVQYPVTLEQRLMEGSYNKVLRYCPVLLSIYPLKYMDLT